MSIDDLEPGPETDRLVAEALGVPLVSYDMHPPCYWINEGYSTIDRRRPFCPSTDLNDAFWAAERAGLFTFRPLVTLFRNPEEPTEPPWCVYDEDSERSLGAAVTPALAICKAILKLKGNDGQSDG